MEEWRRIRVAASSANLGPGFDAIAIALSLFLECRFRPSQDLRIQVTGRDAGLIDGGPSNLIWRTAMETARSAGSSMPCLEMEIQNQIPVGKGLGSSAAALIAALAITNHVLGLGWSRDRILDEGARREGHPDNAAACVLGSVVATALDSGGRTRAVRMEMPAGIAVAAVVPDYQLPTAEMRAVLPDSYARADAIFNLQRVALLVAALSRGNREAFPAALEDRIHQPYRSHVIPGLEQILALRAPGLLGCSLSGAGPSVLVLFEAGADGVVEKVRQIFHRHGLSAQVLAAQVEPEGYRIC